MVWAPTDSDLIRLLDFLQRLQGNAQDAVEEAELWQHKVGRLKEEIADREAARSRAFLAQIAIDYGATRVSALEIIQGRKPGPLSGLFPR